MTTNNTNDHKLRRALTGDRPTGQLHLGHLAGSLRSRVALQDTHDQFVMIADMQALTDNAGSAHKVSDAVLEVMLDYLAVGIDPSRTTICLQSSLPALPELTMLLMNHVTVARLERNPTVKEEIRLRGFEKSLPVGFQCYPVSQAADITAFRANVVPVGADQAPMIEQTNELVRAMNQSIGRPVLVEATAMMSGVGRLPGIDGRAKMSKSQGNAITLSAAPAEISAAVKAMYTDPSHIRVTDPGRVEGNVVFAFLEAFDPDPVEVDGLKEHYRRGGLGDAVLKQRLDRVLQDVLNPIRERRQELSRRMDDIKDVLRTGTRRSQYETGETLRAVKDGIGIFCLA